ncbi:serine/threonine protein phosphatase [Cereibacter sphaeroides]|uniref:metallophosphoesterase family protein n=1 Tax=Cereibacter sphaeroides TaxID=1063 RepID=UPI000E5A2221|nr:metallophosphoesterase family protein [Cereibacter sphaeroides]RHZ99656.1 serine/threonine protein phosphatase [Cereibacter sphaeroides]
MRSYAIGDIHGHLSLLQEIHGRIAADRARTGDDEAPVVHIGDLVDRGPDSRGVVEYLRQGIEQGENWVVLKGNHDRMFAGFLRDPTHQDPGLRGDLSWLHPRLGGGPTLESYGVAHAADRPVAIVHREAVALVPAEHVAFIEALPAFYRRDEALFVHAGIRPGVPLAEQIEDDLVWIREPFLSDPRDHGMLVVHGHTAIDAVTHYGNRLNLDSGAAYGGPLSAVVIEGRSVWQLSPEGRRPIA